MFLYQGTWKQILSLALHWSVLSRPDRCTQAVTQESLVSSSNSSLTAKQTKVNNRDSGEPPIAYLCLQSVSGAREHICCSTWAHRSLCSALLNLCLFLGAPWRRKLHESVSGKRERSRGAGLDVYPPWQSWTSDDPSPLLLTLHCAQQPAAVSGLMLVGRPAATQTTTHAQQPGSTHVTCYVKHLDFKSGVMEMKAAEELWDWGVNSLFHTDGHKELRLSWCMLGNCICIRT